MGISERPEATNARQTKTDSLRTENGAKTHVTRRELRETSQGPSHERVLGKRERTPDAWEARGDMQQHDQVQAC